MKVFSYMTGPTQLINHLEVHGKTSAHTWEDLGVLYLQDGKANPKQLARKAQQLWHNHKVRKEQANPIDLSGGNKPMELEYRPTINFLHSVIDEFKYYPKYAIGWNKKLKYDGPWFITSRYRSEAKEKARSRIRELHYSFTEPKFLTKEKHRPSYVDLFRELVFEEKAHKYKVKNKQFTSVTTQIKKFYKPFDTSVAKYVAKSRNTTETKIKKEWKKAGDDSRIQGSNAHRFGELYAYSSIANRISISGLRPANKKELAIVNFWQHVDLNRYTVFALELPMYHSSLKLAGTPDIVLLDKEDEQLLIADYKTNSTDIFKNYRKEKMLKPFSRHYATDYIKYALQLSYYQIFLETLGFKVKNRVLIWLAPPNDDKLFRTYDLPDFSKQLMSYHKKIQV